MVFRPVSESRRMNSIFVSVGTICFSFCSPSRGPTSTMRALGGIVISLLFRQCLCALELKQFNAFGHLVADSEVKLCNLARRRRMDGALHFHGFENHQWRAFLHALARLH